MKSKMTEEMVVENLLSEWPIKERQHERQLNALVATLLNGEKRLIEFEKTIVPAEIVGRYIVVEHLIPTPYFPLTRHYNEEIGSYDNYAEAQADYFLKAEHAIKNATEESDVTEIMLVGEFKGQNLKFDKKGVPDINTGFTLGSVLTKSNTELVKVYVDKEPDDPNLPVTINNKLYVELDKETAKLKFEQSVLLGNELNVEFWKVDPGKDFSRKQHKSGSSEDEVLIHKGKRSKKNNAHDFTTGQWVNPSLLSKHNGGSNKGKRH